MTIDKITHKLVEIGAEVNDKQAEQILNIVVALGDIEKLHKGGQCEDAISRQAVINAMYDLCADGKDRIDNPWRDNPNIDAIIDAIENLPSIQPKVVPIAEIRFDDDKLHEIVDEAVKNIEIKSGWIPVSEKLPEKFIDVVVWYARPFSDEQWYGIGYLKENGKWDVDGKSRQEVLAWMPLPEPYKVESEDEG